MRIVSSRFWKLAVRAPATDRFRSTLLPRSRLNVGPPFQVWPLLSCRDGGIRFGRGVVGGHGRRDGGVRLGRRVAGHDGRHDCGVPLTHRPVGQQRVGDGLVHLGRGAVGHQPRREGGIRLGRRVVGREGCRNCGVPLDRRFEGHQRIGDGLGHLGRGAVIGQLGVRVALGLVDGRHDGGGHFFGSREVIAEGRGDGVVGLLRDVRIAREAQGPVVVGELDAQGARGVEVTDRVGPGQQVPGVDQVGGAAEGGDLCKDSVDGGLQGDLQQVAEVSCRGVLEGEDLRVVPVEAGVLEGLSGLVGRVGQVGQKRRGNPLVHVGLGGGEEGGGRRREEEGGGRRRREEGRGGGRRRRREEEGGGG